MSLFVGFEGLPFEGSVVLHTMPLGYRSLKNAFVTCNGFQRCFEAGCCLLVAVYLVQTQACEFECSHAADGCITMSQVYDGRIDCLRDGSDENEDARDLILNLLFPEGKL